MEEEDEPQEPHECPYRVEIEDDYSLCTCSINQENECRDNI